MPTLELKQGVTVAAAKRGDSLATFVVRTAIENDLGYTLNEDDTVMVNGDPAQWRSLITADMRDAVIKVVCEADMIDAANREAAKERDNPFENIRRSLDRLLWKRRL